MSILRFALLAIVIILVVQLLRGSRKQKSAEPQELPAGEGGEVAALNREIERLSERIMTLEKIAAPDQLQVTGHSDRRQLPDGRSE